MLVGYEKGRTPSPLAAPVTTIVRCVWDDMTAILLVFLYSCVKVLMFAKYQLNTP
jgi:hypothetical protein